MNLINVIDSPCGSGKTVWSIQYINKLPPQTKVLFITPFLTECERIIAGCKQKQFVQPNTINGRGRKIVSLFNLIKSNRNIVTTHALFSSLDTEFIAELKNHNYILIIDEAMNVLNKVSIYDDNEELDNNLSLTKREKLDLKTLILTDILKNNGDNIIWNENRPLGKYESLKRKSDTGNLFLMDDDLLMWTFPPELFLDNIFNEIYILTYQFDYQIHSYYFKYYNIQYEKFEVVMSEEICNLYPWGSQQVDLKFRQRAKSLVEICENNRMNSLGSPSLDRYGDVPISAFSINWYKKNEDKYSRVQLDVANFWKNVVGGFAKDRMWTCFKDYKQYVSNSTLSSKNFISINARATNDFANKKYLCYLANRYINPCMVRFFAKRDIYLNQEEFALAELIQWIWRSAIRNGEKIYLYIPSERMRNLLKAWLDI